jgi:hypothetical protein
MLPHLAIGRAVIPGLGLVEGGKLEYDHAFDCRTFEYFLAAIVCAGCNVVSETPRPLANKCQAPLGRGFSRA